VAPGKPARGRSAGQSRDVLREPPDGERRHQRDRRVRQSGAEPRPGDLHRRYGTRPGVVVPGHAARWRGDRSAIRRAVSGGAMSIDGLLTRLPSRTNRPA
jgi:hypothetical protein